MENPPEDRNEELEDRIRQARKALGDGATDEAIADFIERYR